MAYAFEDAKWGKTSLTWSFGTTTYPDDVTYDEPFSAPITDLAVQAVVRSAFARWASVSAMRFTEVADAASPANSPDIRVGFGVLTATAEIGETAYTYQPLRNGGTFLPDVVIRLQDPKTKPVVSNNGVLTYSGTAVTLYQVMLHEIGHALGLDHDAGNPAAVMYPAATAANQDLSPEDIAGVQALYSVPGTALRGTHNQYVISPQTDGSILVQDQVPGRDGAQSLPGPTTLSFSDGVGIADASGVAEDVDRLYQAAFNRAADPAGVQYWANAVHAGQVSLAGVAEGFSRTPEFMAHDGALGNTGYVQALYQNVLGRAGDPSGVAYWTGALAGGQDRGQVLASFASSGENLARTLPVDGSLAGAEATRLYQAAFNRAPDASGQQFWTSVLQNGATPLAVAQGFTATAEFAATYAGLADPAFAAQLYVNVLHRAGDAGGIQFWDVQLAGGATRAQVLAGFADGNENRAGTAAATHDGWAFLG